MTKKCTGMDILQLKNKLSGGQIIEWWLMKTSQTSSITHLFAIDLYIQYISKKTLTSLVHHLIQNIWSVLFSSVIEKLLVLEIYWTNK